MRRKVINTSIYVAVAACLLLSTGCSKVTAENYNRLKMGMDYGEVIEILGEANECKSAIGVKNCIWGHDKKSIEVSFVGEKVILFSGKGL